MKAKQLIIVRKDLKMKPGKFAGQIAHASLGSLLSMFDTYKNRYDGTMYQVKFDKGSVLDEWLNGIFTKVVLSVDSEEELLRLQDRLIGSGIPSALITDAGHTVFDGVPTVTCLGVGPYMAEDLDKLFGHLKLY